MPFEVMNVLDERPLFSRNDLGSLSYTAHWPLQTVLDNEQAFVGSRDARMGFSLRF